MRTKTFMRAKPKIEQRSFVMRNDITTINIL